MNDSVDTAVGVGTLGDVLPEGLAAQLPAFLSAFQPYDASTWSWPQAVLWTAVILLGLELLAWAMMRLAPFFSVLPVRAKHYDVFTPLDWAFVTFNKLTTVAFTYHLLRFCWTSPHVAWALADASWTSVLLPWVLFHIVYDFFYTLLHLALHVRALYPLIHKHHHRQIVPSRGNLDAVNVHPVEFVLGEYNHILAVAIVAHLAPVPTHALAVAGFLVLGGLLASLNHTRFDIRIPFFFSVRAHDVHHHRFTYNYGQYIMLWDRIFGTYRDHAGDVLPPGTPLAEAKLKKGNRSE